MRSGVQCNGALYTISLWNSTPRHDWRQSFCYERGDRSEVIVGPADRRSYWYSGAVGESPFPRLQPDGPHGIREHQESALLEGSGSNDSRS